MSSWDGDTRGGYDETTGWAAPAAQTRQGAREVFAKTMFLVAVTTAFFAFGAYLGRDLPSGWALVLWIASFALIFAIRPARERGEVSPLQMGLLFTFGVLAGLATGPTIAHFADLAGQAVVAQAGVLTALFMALMGSVGYLTSKDLSGIGRICFFALIALIVFGIVGIFVSIPGFALIWSIAGLVIFAGLTAWDFQRLRHAGAEDAAVIALAIFLDALNVFLFILQLLAGGRD